MEVQIALPSYSADEPAIHRLVDDILEYIFLLNATSPDSPPDIPFWKPISPCPEHATTVASSQVCTRWRSIALNCHTIWGLIIDYPRHSLKWIETLLNRSNPSLLDFGSRFNCLDFKNGGQGVLELVFNHIDRLRIFNLYVPVSTWELVRSRFLQLPAPNIEFLHLNFTGTTPGQLTHPLFDNNAPNLQTLRLLRCSVLTSSVLTSLTELYVHDIPEENAVPTVLDWLNILGGMPSLRRVDLYLPISSAPSNDIFPVIHLSALDKLSVGGPFHENVTLVKHLILPPRCGLRLRCYDAHVGFDQRQLCAIIENMIDSWAKNATNRYLNAVATTHLINIGNLSREKDVSVEKEVDPELSITLKSSNPQEAVPLFHSFFALFQRTFFGTTCLRLRIKHDPAGAQAFLPLVDNFRGFVNLEKLVLGLNSLQLLFPLLKQENSILLPKIKSIYFSEVFQNVSDSVVRIADFLQWRMEQGFPVQKIEIASDGRRIDRKYILHIQDTVVEIYGFGG